MRALYKLLVALVCFVGLQGLAKADLCDGGGNLVQNCAFQNADFGGWSLSGNDVPTEAGFLYGVEGTDPFDGISPIGGSSYQAFFADLTSNPTTLSQTIATTAGIMYKISFYLAQDTAAVSPYSNTLDVAFGGTTLINTTDVGVEPYAMYSFTATATGSSTLLGITLGNDLGEFLVDDVSVQAEVPEPSALLLLLTALLACGRQMLWRAGRMK